MNYLELVNEAIRESGIELDSLNSSTFVSTTEPMHIRFKKWVARAWEEIQVIRGEWEFMTGTKTISLFPRIYAESCYDANGTGSAGDQYLTEETGVTLTIADTTVLSGTWTGGDAVCVIDLETRNDVLKLNETADYVLFSGAGLDGSFVIKARGLYDLPTELGVSNAEPLWNEFYVQETGNSSIQANTGGAGLHRVELVEWALFNDYNMTNQSFGMPKIIAKNPDGCYDFWPSLDKEYTFRITYNAPPVALSLYSDTPDIPTHYHNAIVWRAVLFYARYDHREELAMEAARSYSFYKKQLDRYLKPSFAWGRSHFDG